MSIKEQSEFEEYLSSHGVALPNLPNDMDLKKLSLQEAKRRFDMVKGLVDSINLDHQDLRKQIKGD